ncbi:hypothetical protein KC318_g3906 [Hortaea werneckii]|nr:hypothetical protein KC334_g4124 [Hortaea werneckii]KAI7016624.1 hypothetical protein KC355_g3929 [Hortaea werneckii]KAI7670676.1 hypothetical protein KC318_g3906 [Hortaea werneckii]
MRSLHRKDFYLRCYDIFLAPPCVHSQRRSVSTTGAINRGLRATRSNQSSESNQTSENRNLLAKFREYKKARKPKPADGLPSFAEIQRWEREVDREDPSRHEENAPRQGGARDENLWKGRANLPNRWEGRGNVANRRRYQRENIDGVEVLHVWSGRSGLRRIERVERGTVERIRSLLDNIQASNFPDREPGKIFTPRDPRLQEIFDGLSTLGLLRDLSHAQFRERFAVLAEVGLTTQSKDKAGKRAQPFYPPYMFRRKGNAKKGGVVVGISCRADEKQQGFQLWFDARGPAGVQVPGPERGVVANLPDYTNGYSPHQPEGRQNKAIEDGNKATEKENKTTESEDVNAEEEMPLSIPFSTAASEFLYGSNVVLAALRAKRRRIHHLYVSRGAQDRSSDSAGTIRNILDLARRDQVPVEADASIKLLDKMSGDRPHNGVILETSKLPAPPTLSLSKPDLRTSIIPLTLDRQSAEDIAVNGAPSAISTSTKGWRFPFVIMLDGILDPANLGSVMRTAHFYGADAVAIATNTCAPLTSAVLAKASSGACEAVQLLALPKPANFVFDSAKAGWRIYASVAPTLPGQATARDVSRQTTTTAVSLDSPLARAPVILMLGAEGEGLRGNLTSKADHLISIEAEERTNRAVSDVGVDSLNVGVAAGVLIEAFMRKPATGTTAAEKARQGDLGF